MATTAQALVSAKYAENVETTQYTSAGARTIVDKCTAYSPAGGTITFRLVPSGGSAGASNITVVKTLATNETYTFPEIVGQILGPGEFISTLAGASNTVSIRISGRVNT